MECELEGSIPKQTEIPAHNCHRPSANDVAVRRCATQQFLVCMSVVEIKANEGVKLEDNMSEEGPSCDDVAEKRSKFCTEIILFLKKFCGAGDSITKQESNNEPTNTMSGLFIELLDLSHVPALSPPSGVIPNFIDPYSRGPIFMVLSAIAIGIMYIFVIIRFYSKLHIKASH